jgi:hypothetical protein
VVPDNGSSDDEGLDDGESLWPEPPDDAELERRAAVVTASWRARLLATIDAYESLDTFYEECGAEPRVEVRDGVEHTVIEIGWTDYAREITVLGDLLTEADLFVFASILDWLEPDGYQSGDDLQHLSTPDVLRYLSASLRADRFMNGVLAGSIDSGFFPALLGRLKGRYQAAD